ncbi:uncharacterized protein LOC124888894 [Capsicum annuum]|uniref:uncharacterized protein LOC124888894 n=1 Tax=Capsicum annuum TaxID=4072 RepID=UPI001FB0C428|nr:uncharacterized protein LOC124888894 [Capsicum annuum]
MAMLKQLTVNVPLVEALEQMSGYAKFMKELMTKKRTVSYEPVDNLHHCSAISTRSLAQKKADPGAFTIPCTVESLDFDKALYRSVKQSEGIFVFPADFVGLYYDVDLDVPIILGRLFLATGRVIVDMELNKLKFRLNKSEVEREYSYGTKHKRKRQEDDENERKAKKKAKKKKKAEKLEAEKILQVDDEITE